MHSCPLPSLSRSDINYVPAGGYWRGSAWLPTTYMTIKGLDGHGDFALARRLARETVFAMFETYKAVEPHTIWECYSTTEFKPGTYGKRPGYSRPDFCGWSALGPISLFIEDIIGVKQADAFAGRLLCDFPEAPVGRVGVANYQFGEIVCDIVATADEIAVESNKPFTLVADGKELAVAAGENVFSRKGLNDKPSASASPRGKANFGDWRDSLPQPIFDERPEIIDFYHRAWEIAHTHIVNVPGLPAPRYMDCGHRSDRIWIWDTCFMALYCKYAPKEFPGIESLENFYSLMLDDDGRPLPRVIGNRWCDADEGKLLEFMIHHPDNPPLFAWTELSHALQTGDRARLEKVFVEKRWLQRWFERFDTFDPDAPKPRGTCVRVALRRTEDGYHWKGTPSGMDNTPRGRSAAFPANAVGLCPDNTDLLWLEALAQQGLSALCLSRVAEILGLGAEAAEWRSRWAAIRDKENALYWDDEDGFYYDILASDRSKVKVQTIASYWPLLADMPTPEMAARLKEKLTDPASFGAAKAV